MRIINKKHLLIVLLAGVILTGVIIFKPNKKVQLDNVILKQEVNNKTFAMYKEADNGYEEYKDTKFPDMYVLNLTESKCIDNNGNKLEGVLSYENNKVVIEGSSTIYCYLYFDKSLGLEIKEQSPDGLMTDTERGAMYRFQGQAKDESGNELVDNYICFGTSDLKTCTDNQDKYMYRIIGIEAETGRVKVIKKEALDQAYQWYTDYNTDIKLPNSVFFTKINGSDFLDNTNYIPTDWKGKISDNTWMYGDMWENGEIGAKQLGAGLYETESGKKSTSWYVKSTQEEGGSPYEVQWEGNTQYYKQILYYKTESGNWTDTIDSKVSLMYLNDYSYSVGDEAKCNYYYGNTEYEKCKLGWIHLSQNDSSVTGNGVHEWTMSRYGCAPWHGAFLGLCVDEAGYTSDTPFTSRLSVRPVFFIDASQKLKSGTGTLEDPFIIEF